MSSAQGENHQAGRLLAKVVLVTGGGNGMGRAIARAAAREGAKVAVLDLDGDASAAVAHEIGSADAVALQGDVSDLADADSAVTETVEHFGQLDVLMNIAGIYDLGAPIEEVTAEAWDRILAINVRGTLFMVQRAFREMLPARSGSIVNMASTSSFVAGGAGVAYTASKGAIASLTRQMAWEGADRGVRVNALAPGATETNLPATTLKILGDDAPTGPLTKRLMARMADGAAEKIPLGRFATPDEIAGPAIFLASSEASYVTGAILMVDGGLSIS